MDLSVSYFTKSKMICFSSSVGTFLSVSKDIKSSSIIPVIFESVELPLKINFGSH